MRRGVTTSTHSHCLITQRGSRRETKRLSLSVSRPSPLTPQHWPGAPAAGKSEGCLGHPSSFLLWRVVSTLIYLLHLCESHAVAPPRLRVSKSAIAARLCRLPRHIARPAGAQGAAAAVPPDSIHAWHAQPRQRGGARWSERRCWLAAAGQHRPCVSRIPRRSERRRRVLAACASLLRPGKRRSQALCTRHAVVSAHDAQYCNV